MALHRDVRGYGAADQMHHTRSKPSPPHGPLPLNWGYCSSHLSVRVLLKMVVRGEIHLFELIHLHQLYEGRGWHLTHRRTLISGGAQQQGAPNLWPSSIGEQMDTRNPTPRSGHRSYYYYFLHYHLLTNTANTIHMIISSYFPGASK